MALIFFKLYFIEFDRFCARIVCGSNRPSHIFTSSSNSSCKIMCDITRWRLMLLLKFEQNGNNFIIFQQEDFSVKLTLKEYKGIYYTPSKKAIHRVLFLQSLHHVT